MTCPHPECRKRITVIAALGDPAQPGGPGAQRGIVWVHPPRRERKPVDGLELAPESVRSLYGEVLGTFNSTAPYKAIFGMVREVTEAMVVEHIPGTADESAAKLAERLRELPEHLNLAEPLLQVARSIQLGGGKGVHFSRSKAVGSEHRDHIMDMLDALIEYLYVIPKRAEVARLAFMEMVGETDDAAPEVQPGYAYLPPELRKALDKKAKASGMDLEAFVRQELKKLARPDRGVSE